MLDVDCNVQINSAENCCQYNAIILICMQYNVIDAAIMKVSKCDKTTKQIQICKSGKLEA